MKEMAITFVLVLLATGCQQFDYIQDAPAIVEAADWSKMQTVTVYMSESAFSPDKMAFALGVPYKLEIINNSTAKHHFNAEKFFRAIATHHVYNSDGEIRAPYFSSLAVYPGCSLNLYFIPVKKGFYDLRSDTPGREGEEIVGRIAIN
ncbi:MAG: cupredoxin domain-containing protein [Planctomycetota bacterium]|jgi:uncharacterized cupredoxin-like copper-binding protein